MKWYFKFTLVALYLKELDLVPFTHSREKKNPKWEDNLISIELYEYVEAIGFLWFWLWFCFF